MKAASAEMITLPRQTDHRILDTAVCNEHMALEHRSPVKGNPIWTLVRYTWNISLFLLVVVALNVLAENVFWQCFLPYDVRDKLALFRDNKDAVDLVFLGSSFTQNQVNPIVFDAELKKRGHSVRSINCALLMLSAPESEALIRRIADFGSTSLKWVMLEPHWPYVSDLSVLANMSERSIWWHSPRATSYACAFEWSADEPISIRASKVCSQLRHALTKELHIGRWRDMLADSSGRLDQVSTPDQLRQRMGYIPFAEAPKPDPRYGKVGLREHQLRVADYEKATSQWRPSMLRPSVRSFFSGQEERLRRLGLELLYVAPPPTFRDPGEVRQLEKDGHISKLFDYTNVSSYPQFYECDAFNDICHLTDEKSEEFTRLLANDFADYLEGKR